MVLRAIGLKIAMRKMEETNARDITALYLPTLVTSRMWQLAPLPWQNDLRVEGHEILHHDRTFVWSTIPLQHMTCPFGSIALSPRVATELG